MLHALAWATLQRMLHIRSVFGTARLGKPGVCHALAGQAAGRVVLLQVQQHRVQYDKEARCVGHGLHCCGLPVLRLEGIGDSQYYQIVAAAPWQQQWRPEQEQQPLLWLCLIHHHSMRCPVASVGLGTVCDEVPTALHWLGAAEPRGLPLCTCSCCQEGGMGEGQALVQQVGHPVNAALVPEVRS